MILPSKHINFSQSLLGLGAFVLSQLESPKTMDELWGNYLSAYQNKDYPAKQSFDNLMMTLLFLYSIDSIIEKEGMIIKCV